MSREARSDLAAAIDHGGASRDIGEATMSNFLLYSIIGSVVLTILLNLVAAFAGR